MGWLKSTDVHPLVSESVFHYEFEFIHPFHDGNGRVGRLWQLILGKWNPLFFSIPVESLVYKRQKEYYKAINSSTNNSESSPFIEFMLDIISQALNTPVTPEVVAMLRVLKADMSRMEIMNKLDLKDAKHFREHYVQPAIAKGLLEMTLPDKPNSRLQKYRLTGKGESIVKQRTR